MSGLRDEEIRELRDCFNLYDRDGSGRIPCQELGTVVRSLGVNPTDQDVDKTAKALVKNNHFNFDDLCRVMAKLRSEPRFEEDDIRDAFKGSEFAAVASDWLAAKQAGSQKQRQQTHVFDRDGNGVVNAAELRHVMTNLGEKLTDEEVDEMIRAVDVDPDGQVVYEDWVRLMCVAARRH